MSNKQLYTHLALAGQLGVSVTTIKSYRRKFPGCIPVASQGKPIRFGQEAYDVCVRVRDLFATGMSVEEVRSRLATEFSWISPEAPPVKEPETGAKAALPPLFTSAMSDMAQNLVGLAQKQGTVLTRLEEIGSVISSAPPERPAPAPFDAVQADRPAAPASPVTPAAQVAPAAHSSPVPAFPPAGAPENPAWAERPPWMNEFAELTERLTVAVEHLADTVTRLGQWSRVLASQTPPPPSSLTAARPAAPEAAAGMRNAPREDIPARQPGRNFLAMPLVITGQDGLLHGIAGQGRGRFTCVDIKAMAACPGAPERACSLEWEEAGSDWALSLRGLQEGEILARALLREVADSLGNTAVLLHQVYIGDEERNPTDFFIFLRDRM